MKWHIDECDRQHHPASLCNVRGVPQGVRIHDEGCCRPHHWQAPCNVYGVQQPWTTILNADGTRKDRSGQPVLEYNPPQPASGGYGLWQALSVPELLAPVAMYYHGHGRVRTESTPPRDELITGTCNGCGTESLIDLSGRCYWCGELADTAAENAGKRLAASAGELEKAVRQAKSQAARREYAHQAVKLMFLSAILVVVLVNVILAVFGG